MKVEEGAEMGEAKWSSITDVGLYREWNREVPEGSSESRGRGRAVQ
jgi:hypothetical protein